MEFRVEIDFRNSHFLVECLILTVNAIFLTAESLPSRLLPGHSDLDFEY